MTQTNTIPAKTFRVRYLFEGELSYSSASKENVKERLEKKIANNLPAIEKLLGLVVVKDEFAKEVTLEKTIEKNYFLFNAYFELKAEETMDGESEDAVLLAADEKVRAGINRIDSLLGTNFKENTTFIDDITKIG